MSEAWQSLFLPRVSSRRKRRLSAAIAECRGGGKPRVRRFRKARSARDRSQLPANWRLHKNPRTCFEGPFGEVIRATGPMARANPFRFSTKYQDDEPDLVYYGYRYYSASTGRWLSKDVVRSWVEINLCAFVKNNPVNNADYLGLQITPGITNVPHVPRPYPPRTPFPQKLLKKYDCSCCNAEEIKRVKRIWWIGSLRPKGILTPGTSSRMEMPMHPVKQAVTPRMVPYSTS